MTHYHTVNSYDQELIILNNSLLAMIELAYEILILAKSSILTHTENLIQQTKELDAKINNYYFQIEQQATDILALRQPMAIDLRQVISALRLASIIERMGDLAKNTVKRASLVSFALNDELQGEFLKICTLIERMMSDATEALRTNNSNTTLAVCAMDEEVDQAYNLLMNKLQDLMVHSPSDIPSIMQVMFAIKNIERIGDYVTKIIKIVHYIASGERIKAPRKKHS